MNLEIGPFTIVSDNSQFTLYQKRSVERTVKGKKTGEVVLEDSFCGYYSTLDSCLKYGLPRHGLLRSDCLTLSDVVEELKSYRKLIEKALNPGSFFIRTKIKG